MGRKLTPRLWRACMLLACGGAMAQLGTCNPNVRDAVLTGLETTSVTLANTLIRALFDGLGDGNGGSSLLMGL